MEEEFSRIDEKRNDSIVMFDSTAFRVDKFVQAANKSLVMRYNGGFMECVQSTLTSLGLGRIAVKDSSNNYNFSDWTEKGMDCEILNPNGKGWQKGKARIRIILEFCPDEANEGAIASSKTDPHLLDSSLDDIRQEIANKSQNGQA
jgi:KGK domain